MVAVEALSSSSYLIPICALTGMPFISVSKLKLTNIEFSSSVIIPFESLPPKQPSTTPRVVVLLPSYPTFDPKPFGLPSASTASFARHSEGHVYGVLLLFHQLPSPPEKSPTKPAAPNQYNASSLEIFK